MSLQFAFFQIPGEADLWREKWISGMKVQSSLDSSRRMRLLIASGPVDLPKGRDFSIISTFSGEVIMLLKHG